jgi:hypothetical protein
VIQFDARYIGAQVGAVSVAYGTARGGPYTQPCALVSITAASTDQTITCRTAAGSVCAVGAGRGND